MGYVYEEYPKWVGDVMVQDENEEAEALAQQAKKPTKSNPLKVEDHSEADERKALMEELSRLGVKFFKGAKTEVLKAKLAEATA